jgi:hypothetical protein
MSAIKRLLGYAESIARLIRIIITAAFMLILISVVYALEKLQAQNTNDE